MASTVTPVPNIQKSKMMDEEKQQDEPKVISEDFPEPKVSQI